MSRLLLLAAIFGLAASAAAPPSDDPWRYVDPTAKALVGIQWKHIYESPAGQKMRQQMKDSIHMPALPGLDFLSSVDAVIFSSTGVENPKPGQPAPALIAVTGHFDLAKLRASVSQKSRRAVVQSIEIFEGADKGQNRMGIALVSPALILLGDTPTLVRAVGSSASPDSSVIARAKLLNDHNEFWAVTSISPANVSGASFPLPVPADEIRGLDMGMAIRDGLGMDLNLQTRSPESARKIKNDLAKAIQMAGKEKSMPDLVDFNKVTKISVEKEFVKITIRMDAADLEKRMAAYKARAAQTVAKAESPAPAIAATPAAAPAVRKKPVIYNLDPPDFE